MILGEKEMKKGKTHVLELLLKLTHLKLEDKGIELVANLSDCKSLTHIFLQENRIYTLVNEPFKGLQMIVQLNLYNNRIDRMEGFLDLINLKKLYLEKNLITRLDGLDNCRKLEELYLGNQDLPKNTIFQFDEYSLAAISGTLRVLDMPNC